MFMRLRYKFIVLPNLWLIYVFICHIVSSIYRILCHLHPFVCSTNSIENANRVEFYRFQKQ